MDRFLHTSVRLNTDLGRATRFFSQPVQMTRWLCSNIEAAPDGTVLSLVEVINSEDRWEWCFEEIKREKSIRLQCSNFLQPDESAWFPLEIQLMKCTSLTEYCSEIHVIQHGFEESEPSNLLRSQYLELWKTKLEALRVLVNGKWIIEDRDLSLDMFK